MSGLNPCPFCGCNHLKMLGNYCNTVSAVVCARCEAQGPKIESNELSEDAIQREAILAWNKAAILKVAA